MKVDVYEHRDSFGITRKSIEADEELSGFLKVLKEYLELRCLEMAG